MKVTFVKKDERRYAVEVSRDRYPDLWCGTIGYDDWLPHDLLHFVAEAEFGLDGAVFGDLAAGGNARIFQSFDPGSDGQDVAQAEDPPDAPPRRTPLGGARLGARARLASENAPTGAPAEAGRPRGALARAPGGRVAHARVAAPGRTEAPPATRASAPHGHAPALALRRARPRAPLLPHRPRVERADAREGAVARRGRGDRRPRGRGRGRGQGAGARARGRRARARPARPDDRAPRQRTVHAVVGGRPPRGGGSASRRRRTPQGRVRGGRVRRGRAAPGRRSASRPRSRRRAGSSRPSGSPPPAHGLEALVFGPADLAASLGVPVLTIGAGASDYALARVVAAARASGLQVLDGPHARLGDDLGLVLSARRALEHGYDGKWVIHPSQIEPVNRIFTPSPADLERAQAAPRSRRPARPASRASWWTRRRESSPSRCSGAPSCSPSGLPPLHLRPRAAPRDTASRDACHHAAEGTSEP